MATKKNTGPSLSTQSLSLLVSESKLADLWRLDTLGILDHEETKNKRILEDDVMKHFVDTVKRNKSGRYEVALPWVLDNSILPDNRNLAEKCLKRTESKLISNDMKREYTDVFSQWESDGVIECVIDGKEKGTHYLPHRPVIKESSETTKIRPVFNASAHLKNSPSLNECLTKGLNLIDMIPSILNRFRKYRIGISSDIEKAFLQISIIEKDRDYLRFFWLNETNELKVYRHKRVVFGLTSSPFLLAATLGHLLNQVPDKLSDTASLLKDSFYVDNSLTSLDSPAEIEKFISESQMILSSGHFNLRCWKANVPNSMINDIDSEITPVLGMLWHLKDDTLTCKIEKTFCTSEPITKRKILSITQRVFDPIGFTAPLMLIPKLIIQETWLLKLKWDEELPPDLGKRFLKYLRQLPSLSELHIPRWLNVRPGEEDKVSIHVFCDACKSSYATCIFLRIETLSSTKVQLVNARSRVAPIKPLTIPRLELLSCLIGARLFKTVCLDLKLTKVNTVFWSDSSTALGWIRREQQWGTFVHNRVKEIRSLTDPYSWRHVPGNLNAADLPSRGCSVEQLLASKWWEGPSWLYSSENQWPQIEEKPDEKILLAEKRKTILTMVDAKENESDWYYRYFSSFTKLVRMISWIMRFYHNVKNPGGKISAPNLSLEEIEKSEKVLYRLIQKDSFTGLTDLAIRSLRPIEGKDGIVRAKTNVAYRKDFEEFRYPIILPSKHPVVERLIFERHVKQQHSGVTMLMADLRETLWIIKSRKTVRNVIRKCVICQRFSAQKLEAEPGIPPEDRVRDAQVFEIVGIDLAGPLHLKDGTKSWIVLFSCAVYRAVHMELVTTLSTEGFIQSFRRFIARRGKPYVIYSDNGKNFVGTNRALQNIDWDTVLSIASTHKIKWKFNPPSAAWWGGWWERLIGMVKKILRKVLGRASLSYEELNTVLCDAEQVINSRPITYVSEDVKDPSPLSPLMFLQELPSTGIPDIDVIDGKELSRRARYRQKIRDALRKRFRNEYLGQLRQRPYKEKKLKPLAVNDIVLLDNGNKYRVNWPLARIIEMYPGKDKVVRTVKIKTETGTLLRPIQKLYRLEIQDTHTQEVNATEQTTSETPSPLTSVFTRSGRIVRPPRRLQMC